MPKEKIIDDVAIGLGTEVTWKRDETGPGGSGTSGHVQIATVNPDSPFQFPDISTEGHWEAGEDFDGWRVTLDARGIDRIVDALLKAKRQAFPPDSTGTPVSHGADA